MAPALADALGVESSGADGGAVAAAAAALLSAGTPASRATEGLEGLGLSLRDVAEAVAPETDPTPDAAAGRGRRSEDAVSGARPETRRRGANDSDADTDSDDGDLDEATVCFVPGARVSRRDAAKLRLRPLRPLAEGETVALAERRREKEKPRAKKNPAEAAAEAAAARAASRNAGVDDGIAASVKPPREEEKEEKEEKEKTASPKRHFVYARVVSAARPAGGARALASATLETSPGVHETRLASEVFTFALVSELAAERGETNASPETRATSETRVLGNAFVSRLSHDDASSETVRVSNGATRDEGGRSVGANPDGSVDEAAVAGAAAGPSPAAFARAVRELLAAAGTPMPSDAERMLAAHQELRADLAAAAAKAAAAARSEKETLAKAAAASNAFLCPVTQTAMVDPVTAMDGHTYERAAIERWFANGRATSPVTNARLSSLMLVPNHALKSARAAFEDARLGASEAANEDEERR